MKGAKTMWRYFNPNPVAAREEDCAVRAVSAALGDLCLEPITGSIQPSRRQEIIDEFDKAPDGAVLLAQIQAGGTGLNIQSASVVIICEPQIKPSLMTQALSRVYRMGQIKNVLVYNLLCPNTADEKMMKILAQKQFEFDSFANESAIADALDNRMDTEWIQKVIAEEAARYNEPLE
jgi:SNF2 family DNA or RNA helicase